jgi:hypothetical protein
MNRKAIKFNQVAGNRDSPARKKKHQQEKAVDVCKYIY